MTASGTITKPEVRETVGNAVPFAEAFAPFRQYAGEELSRLAPRIDAAAAADLENEIVAELNRVSAHTLQAECSAAGAAESAFGHDLGIGGWVRMLRRYPVLARLMQNVVAYKLDEAREFAARLESDLPALHRGFGNDFTRVVRIRSGCGDPHRRLRTVKIVEFHSGARLVYKPRDLALQTAWNGLLEWLNRRVSLPLRAPAVLNRSTHGWMELVETAAAADEAAVGRFHRRLGSLLCLMYALRAEDCHLENLLAAGEHPVLVDTEALMQPEFKAQSPPSAPGPLRKLRVPPAWEPANESDNTSIATGFEETHRVLVEHRDELLAGGGPVAAFRGLPARFILHPACVYRLLLDGALHPKYLCDECAFTQHLETFLRRLPPDRYPRDPRMMWAAEIEALRRLDIPLFTTGTDSRGIITDRDEFVPGLMRVSGYDAVRARFAGMSESDG